jgi:Ferric reductase like transmembrane component
MDKNMDMGVPSVANLPLSDPKCKDAGCIAFDAATNRSQELTPWAGQFAYGRWTTWYSLVILFIFTLFHGLRTWKDRRDQTCTTKFVSPSLRQKVLATGRYLAYRRSHRTLFYLLEIPSFGLLALLLVTVIFLSILTFTARPYYRAHEGYGSPPIAIRTGLMAFACTPFLIALAGKANLITLLTGVSHERLNVVHQWVGWMTLVLSLVHTIPFIVVPIRDRGYTSLTQEFYGYGLIGGTMVRAKP